MLSSSWTIKGCVTVGIWNFGIVYFKRYISKLCWTIFRSIGTLRSVLCKLIILVFSLEAPTPTLTNLSVFFLVHEVSVTEKQLFCVHLRVLNLYGVYWGHFSCLVWRFSVSPFVPFSVLAFFVPGEFWNYLCSGI